MRHASGAGQNLASSFNIAAFNLGNAMGAWLGGFVIERGPGLEAVTWAAAAVTVAGLAVALWSVRLENTSGRSAPQLAAGACERS
jgi:DHA1 family inner membrane transport protein